MNPTALARIVAGALTGVWLLAIVLAWLLLPQVLGLAGALLVLWYSLFWLVALFIATIPFFVVSSFRGR